MSELVFFGVGAVLGGVAAWLVAAARSRSAAAAAQVELRTRSSALESTVSELRGQISERDASLESLRRELDAAQQRRVAAETRCGESLKNIEAQRKLLEDAQKKLEDVFTALSTKALRSNAEEFAKQTAEKVRPLSETLKRYEDALKQLESERQRAYGSLNEQLQAIARTHRELTRQTTTLSTALRAPHVKGRWGEITLRNAVELAGLSRYCDFVEQSQTDDADSRRKPDMVVRLPGGRTIVIDAKTPTGAYLDAIEAESEEQRQAHRRQHAADVRQTMRQLSSKAYWSEFAASAEFVVMFVPGESFFSAALEQDRDLIEEGIRNRVILASPTTLIALLRSVALSWQQQELVENARRIGEIAGQLYERVCKFADHLGGVGLNLRQAVEAYNRAVGSWEHRVLPMGQRMDELGVRVHNAESARLEQVDASIRALPAEDVEPGGSRPQRPDRAPELFHDGGASSA